MNLLRALLTVSGMTMFSRLLGFVRDAMIARYFGVSMATDVFFVAFKLPNLLRRVFAEGAFSQAFVPILAEYKAQRTHAETRLFLADVSGLLMLALLVICVLGTWGAPVLIYLTASGFSAGTAKFDLAVDLLRWIFPYIFLISMASLASGVLNTHRSFTVPAFMPTLLNLCFIAAVAVLLLFKPHLHEPVYVLAWAVLAGGLLQWLAQWPFLARHGMLVWPRLDWHDSGVWRIVRQMGTAMFAVSISQISLVLNTNYATFLPDGSVSWMYYADRLMELPTGVLGVALGTILLPSLSKHHAEENLTEYSRLLDWGLRLCLLLSVPAALGLMILAQPLILTLFGYGKFGSVNVHMTSLALMAYAVGLPGLMLVKVLVPGFYGRKDVKTPVRIAVMTLVATQLMNLLFIFPFKHAGLALSISLAACLNAGLLFSKLKGTGVYRLEPGWARFLGQLGTASAAMALLLLCFRWGVTIPEHAKMWLRLLYLLPVVVGGGVVYFAVLYVLGMHPRDFMRREH